MYNTIGIIAKKYQIMQGLICEVTVKRITIDFALAGAPSAALQMLCRKPRIIAQYVVVSPSTLLLCPPLCLHPRGA